MTVQTASVCGTVAGYHRHYRRNEPACELCLKATREAARRRPDRVNNSPKPPALCGTPSGYQRHRRRGEQPCKPCKDASNTYSKERRRVTRTQGRSKLPCGTRAAYLRHLRRNEVPCAPCRSANNLATRRRSKPRKHWWVLWVKQGSLCPLCRNLLPCGGQAVHVDHIIPISDGGSNDLNNLQLTHKWCNLVKGSRSNDWALEVLGSNMINA